MFTADLSDKVHTVGSCVQPRGAFHRPRVQNQGHPSSRLGAPRCEQLLHPGWIAVA